jgi:hypothetical protein
MRLSAAGGPERGVIHRFPTGRQGEVVSNHTLVIFPHLWRRLWETGSPIGASAELGRQPEPGGDEREADPEP